MANRSKRHKVREDDIRGILDDYQARNDVDEPENESELLAEEDVRVRLKGICFRYNLGSYEEAFFCVAAVVLISVLSAAVYGKFFPSNLYAQAAFAVVPAILSGYFVIRGIRAVRCRDEIAAIIDRDLGLKERLTTWLEYAESGKRPALYNTLVTDAVNSLDDRSVNKVLNRKVSWQVKALLVVALLLGVASILLPPYITRERDSIHEEFAPAPVIAASSPVFTPTPAAAVMPSPSPTPQAAAAERDDIGRTDNASGTDKEAADNFMDNPSENPSGGTDETLPERHVDNEEDYDGKSNDRKIENEINDIIKRILSMLDNPADSESMPMDGIGGGDGGGGSDSQPDGGNDQNDGLRASSGGEGGKGADGGSSGDGLSGGGESSSGKDEGASSGMDAGQGTGKDEKDGGGDKEDGRQDAAGGGSGGGSGGGNGGEKDGLEGVENSPADGGGRGQPVDSGEQAGGGGADGVGDEIEDEIGGSSKSVEVKSVEDKMKSAGERGDEGGSADDGNTGEAGGGTDGDKEEGGGGRESGGGNGDNNGKEQQGAAADGGRGEGNDGEKGGSGGMERVADDGSRPSQSHDPEANDSGTPDSGANDDSGDVNGGSSSSNRLFSDDGESVGAAEGQANGQEFDILVEGEADTDGRQQREAKSFGTKAAPGEWERPGVPLDSDAARNVRQAEDDVIKNTNIPSEYKNIIKNMYINEKK